MKLDFDKTNGLIPAIIQDANTQTVLMLGYMNEEALKITETTGKVTFFSRSKNRLWTKGETSGNFLTVVDILSDCDNDTLLIKAIPAGPVCHTGNDTCFNETSAKGFVFELENLIADRKQNPKPGSYTNSLLDKGINKVAQKVGEEATEVVIEAIDDNIERLKEEAADLLYHYLILLQAKDLSLTAIEEVLKRRNK
tara:strand:- start:1829 stop:2416 length:588 start_codon:yes stop_codon:yes gene_type:complete